ncbi:AmmeMemoRadiSam system protein B [Pseudomonadota bacterium]
MGNIRPAAVAGMFYPDDAETLHQFILDNLNQCNAPPPLPPKAIISPHAGFVYSGPIAACVYRLLQNARNKIKKVVLLGPSHRVPLLGLAASNAEYFTTPLGVIPVDTDAIKKLLTLPQVKVLNEAHTMEHSLEVQLPFLQTVLDDFTLIPLVVGDANPQEVAEVLETLWGDDETLIVISSDLSHYHDYKTAQKMDRTTSEAIVNLQPEKIHHDDACGRIPITGLLTIAKQKGLKAKIVDLRNSGDTAGDKTQVVGYGAYAFEYE